MSYKCDYCDRKPAQGNQIEIRGKAKYLGGVGTKVTGITRRTFKPNLQTVKITTPNGTNKTVRVCTKCLKSGVVRKAVKQRPFRLPASATKGAAPAASAAKGAPAAKGK
jgi:large subunit ribosomal protein L28